MEQYGRYEILKKIATGGMAEIFLARPVAFLRSADVYALKRIRRSYSQQPHFVSRFIDEARLCLDLHHANVVRVHDFGQLEGAYFMAMDFVDGADLAVVMRALHETDKALPAKLAAWIASEVAAGLHYAHEKTDSEGAPIHIVHRDVSPQNILLSNVGEVKVADFGIAAARNKVALTTPGTVLGKLAYMSPEQASGGTVDRRADLWGLGVLLHEMLTCQPLFHGAGGAAAVAQAIHETIAPPSATVPSVPKELDAVVMHLLTRDVTRRFQTADEARLALLPIAAGADGTTLAALLESLQLSKSADTRDVTREMAASAVTRVRSERVSADSQEEAKRDLVDDEAKDLLTRFAQDGNVWRLVELGDRLARVYDANANAAYRTAALVFAGRGYLVQALCALDGARSNMHPAERREELFVLSQVARGEADELVELVRRVGGKRFLPLLRELHPDAFESNDATRVLTPLFGHLSPRNFARLADVARVTTVAANTVVLQEGDPSDSLYAVGTGRFLASCSVDDRERFADAGSGVGDRVSLASFADGDFFGEFSFLTERPRTATVESIAPGIIVEISHEMVDDLLAEEPSAVEPLLAFYKERVVEMSMAKSPVFGILPIETRRQLLRDSELLRIDDQTLILDEGSKSDGVFFVKSGEVEIFHTEGGVPVFIDKLSQGQFFGEASALTGNPRSASVRAMGDAELFRFPLSTIDALLAREPKVKARLQAFIESRQHERERLVKEHRELFGAL